MGMLVEILENNFNKNIYEELILQENKVDGGWRNDNNYISESDVQEFLLIQKSIFKKFNIECSLISAEYYWSDYCTTVYKAEWLKPCPDSLNEFAVYLEKNYISNNEF